jgi:hypothetical protein
MPASGAGNPPVFNLIVYVAREGACVKAWGAELPHLAVSANSEREALQQLVALFKAYAREQLASGNEPVWRRPAPPPGAQEQTRFLAVHL